jgi:hypothetical protein
MSELESLERHGAQALLATYLQMARYAHLARALQQARERSIEQRLDEAMDVNEVLRLQQQLDAQQGQAAVLEEAVDRFDAQAKDLATFAESGLTYEDFQDMGLGDVVRPEDVADAQRRRQQAEEATSGDGAKAQE